MDSQLPLRKEATGSSSDALPVLSGVPCGSLVGPVLFLIYIDGIKSITLSPDGHLTLYADNMLLYRSISSSADYALLQDNTNRISTWVDANYLFFNIQKCKVMKVTRKRTGICPPTLHLCGQPLHGLLQISWAPPVIRSVLDTAH